LGFGFAPLYTTDKMSKVCDGIWFGEKKVIKGKLPVTNRQSPVASRQKQPQSAFRINNEFRVVIEHQNFDCMDIV